MDYCQCRLPPLSRDHRATTHRGLHKNACRAIERCGGIRLARGRRVWGKCLVGCESQQWPDRAWGRKTQYYTVGLVIRYLDVRFLSRSDADEADGEITKLLVLLKRVFDNLLNVVQAAVQPRLERHIVGANDLTDDSFDV